MKLSISNLVWDSRYDDVMYKFLFMEGISLEVVPSRLFKWRKDDVLGREIAPFEHIEEAKDWIDVLDAFYGIDIVSMHSLLYNIKENIFANSVYRRFLFDYLTTGMDFANAIKCPNLVFGCPRNRNIPKAMNDKKSEEIACGFFSKLASEAEKRNICICIEPIPASFGTNFINTTESAFEFARKINNPFFKVNVDLGTVLSNGENIEDIITDENIGLVNHIHISEPKLAPIRKRDIHQKLAELLRKYNYEKCVSVEMLPYTDVRMIQGMLIYMKGIFC